MNENYVPAIRRLHRKKDFWFTLTFYVGAATLIAFGVAFWVI